MVELRELRKLTLPNTAEGRPDHLSAGSGLVRRGQREDREVQLVVDADEASVASPLYSATLPE